MSHGPPDLPIHLVPPLGGLLSTRGGHGKGLQPCFTIREDLTDRAWRGGWWAEPWPDTWTLVSIDTRTPSTRPTLVSIDTPPTLLRHSSDTLRHSKPAIQTDETRGSCLSSVNSVKLRHSDTSDTSDTPDTPTLDTPTRSDTTHAAVPGHRSSGPRTQLPLHKCPIPLPSDVSQKSETTYCPILHKD